MGKSIKGKELGKGISQRKDGLYQARFVNRFGKRQTIYAKTYTEITKKLRNHQYEDEKRLNVADTKMTVDEWYEIWLSVCKKHCRDTTKRTYAIQYNRLKDSLGWRKLSSLNPLIIQEAFNNLESDSSRRSCKALLVDILNRAIESELLHKNAAINIRTHIDNKEKTEKYVLTTQEIATIYQSSKNSQLYPIFVLALNTGMRIGEILGLTWECVDFNQGVIHVTKTLCYLPNHGTPIYEFHPPKSRAGKRDIPMAKIVKEALIEQKQWHNQISKKYVAPIGFENLVFCSKTNHPLHESNIRAAINYFINRTNKGGKEKIINHFTPHCLRHTFATNCIAQGMNPKILQAILGHTSMQMTTDLYCHVLNDTIKTEMSAITEMV